MQQLLQFGVAIWQRSGWRRKASEQQLLQGKRNHTTKKLKLYLQMWSADFWAVTGKENKITTFRYFGGSLSFYSTIPRQYKLPLCGVMFLIMLWIIQAEDLFLLSFPCHMVQPTSRCSVYDTYMNQWTNKLTKKWNYSVSTWLKVSDCPRH